LQFKTQQIGLAIFTWLLKGELIINFCFEPIETNAALYVTSAVDETKIKINKNIFLLLNVREELLSRDATEKKVRVLKSRNLSTYIFSFISLTSDFLE
jgi:hypothetical protein